MQNVDSTENSSRKIVVLPLTCKPFTAWSDSLLDRDSKASFSGRKHFSLRKEQPIIFTDHLIIQWCPLSYLLKPILAAEGFYYGLPQLMGLDFSRSISTDEQSIWKTKTTLNQRILLAIFSQFFLHIAPSLPVAEIHASRRFFALLDVASCAKLDKTSSMAL